MNICQDGLEIYFATETLQYSYANIYGHYELQTHDVNSYPYFKKGVHGIWYNGAGYWMIGLDNMQGQSNGYAFIESDAFCPNLLPEWKWWAFDGTAWDEANMDIGINCKCLFIKIFKCSISKFHEKILKNYDR